jgi:hypothetical protein
MTHTGTWTVQVNITEDELERTTHGRPSCTRTPGSRCVATATPGAGRPTRRCRRSAMSRPPRGHSQISPTSCWMRLRPASNGSRASRRGRRLARGGHGSDRDDLGAAPAAARLGLRGLRPAAVPLVDLGRGRTLAARVQDVILPRPALPDLRHPPAQAAAGPSRWVPGGCHARRRRSRRRRADLPAVPCG